MGCGRKKSMKAQSKSAGRKTATKKNPPKKRK
jgi:hypothetical protein